MFGILGDPYRNTLFLINSSEFKGFVTIKKKK